MSRCEEGCGGKRVALSQPGRWALESCASANPDEVPTSHDHWGQHRHHLFYIKSHRLNKEANNLQLSRWSFSQIWPSATLIMLVKTVFKLSRGSGRIPFAKKFMNLHMTSWCTAILNEMQSGGPSYNKLQSILVSVLGLDLKWIWQSTCSVTDWFFVFKQQYKPSDTQYICCSFISL